MTGKIYEIEKKLREEHGKLFPWAIELPKELKIELKKDQSSKR
ncbi:hypothetical protein [Crassaminicella indica]|nr:hypothetical protein [Crassaminicella indica]